VQICSKCQVQSPDTIQNCPNCGADLREWSNTAVALKSLQENPRVIYVRISVSQDCCPACRQAEGAYAKEVAPKLPVEGCSHPLGCRCFYQPVLEEIYP
jgi:uncharacterized protein (UPF0212 family)